MATLSCNGKFFKNIDAVFLDKDGTLADVATYLCQLGKTQAQLMEQTVPGTYGLTLKALGVSAQGLTASGLLAVGSRQETVMGTAAAAAMAGYPWVQAVELATSTLSQADQQWSPKVAYTPLLPGALGFLTRLKQANLKVIIVSADTQANLEQFVRHYDLQPYIDHVQGVSDQTPVKTAPDFLPMACRALGLLPQQGVVIGDAASDLRMATSARGFIGYLGGWRPLLSPADILGDQSPSLQALDYGFATDFSQITLVS